MYPLMLLLGLMIIEQLLLWTGLWRWRKPLAFLLSISFTALSIWLAWVMDIGNLLIVFINLYRVIMYGKVLEARLHESYLLFSTRRTSAWLIVFTSLALLIYSQHYSWIQVGQTIAAVQLLAALILLLSTIRRLRHTAALGAKELSDQQLPTLTVAIPARNESIDLEQCLESVLACRYPKLEILVVDDSTAKRRPDAIIKRFAHEGVRFISSKSLQNGWLPKNQAYQRLAEMSSGDLILFCGVDVRFNPDSLRRLVEQMQLKNKQMLCVMPENLSSGGLSGSLIQPIRYAWELSLPRRLFNKPPVLSSCWMITRQALNATGGFSAVSRMVIPEQYFARELIKRDGYSFMRSTKDVGVYSQKAFGEQAETAIRTRYPRLHKRLELVALTTLLEFALLVANLPMLVWAIYTHEPVVFTTFLALVLVLQLITYGMVLSLTYNQPAGIRVLLLAPALLVDVWILNKSMWQYEFSKVFWKGRDVTPAVMHKTPISVGPGRIQ